MLVCCVVQVSSPWRDMTLAELQEMSARQQRQIDTQQQLLASQVQDNTSEQGKYTELKCLCYLIGKIMQITTCPLTVLSRSSACISWSSRSPGICTRPRSRRNCSIWGARWRNRRRSWRGCELWRDRWSRNASAMGNSVSVAALLIMISSSLAADKVRSA